MPIIHTLYSRQQGCKDPRLFFEARRGPRIKNLGPIELEITSETGQLTDRDSNSCLSVLKQKLTTIAGRLVADCLTTLNN
jgi:hypothetical protein